MSDWDTARSRNSTGILRRSVVSGGSIACARANFLICRQLNRAKYWRSHRIPLRWDAIFNPIKACGFAPYNPHKGSVLSPLNPTAGMTLPGPSDKGFQPPSPLGESDPLSALSGKGTALRPLFPLHPFPAVSVHLPLKIYEPLHSLPL